MRLICIILSGIFLSGCASFGHKSSSAGLVVYTTDFGVRDGAVSEMKGVAYGVSRDLVLSDLTHEIPPYDIWAAAYRLQQTYKYWPAGSVFVTVVDPGVGSTRRSVVLRTHSGHYFVGPDNGHMTLVADEAGVDSVRVLDESLQRRKGSEESYTFHGRDLYSYVGARLASKQLNFSDCGPESATPLIRIAYQEPKEQGGELRGMIPILDVNYGNVWTNIPKSIFERNFSGHKQFFVRVRHQGKTAYEGVLPLVDTFSAVGKGQPLLYFNSLLNLSLALNMGDFALKNHIGSGPDWEISVRAK